MPSLDPGLPRTPLPQRHAGKEAGTTPACCGQKEHRGSALWGSPCSCPCARGWKTFITEPSPAEKALGVLVGSSTTRHHCALAAQRANCTLGASGAVWPVGRGRGSAALLCAGTPHLQHPDGECSAQEGHGAVGARPEKGHKEDLRDRHGEMVSN